MERFIEDQAFLWSYDSAHPPPHPTSPIIKLSLFLITILLLYYYFLVFLCVAARRHDVRWGIRGWGRGAESYDRKNLALSQYSLPSDHEMTDM